MTMATVRHIANGYIVTWSGGAGGGIVVPPSVYAVTVPEVVYWLGRIFDPVANPNTQQRAGQESAPAPAIITPNPQDKLLGQQATVSDVASGGFLVTQVPGVGSGAQFVEMYAPTMDQVAVLLDMIYTQPAQREAEEERTEAGDATEPARSSERRRR